MSEYCDCESYSDCKRFRKDHVKGPDNDRELIDKCGYLHPPSPSDPASFFYQFCVELVRMGRLRRDQLPT